MTRKFFKTVIQIEVLSEDTPVSDGISLSDIDFNITVGDWSGVINRVSVTQLSAKEVADALIEQRSDPEFFQVDQDGNEVDTNDNPKEEGDVNA